MRRNYFFAFLAGLIINACCPKDRCSPQFEENWMTFQYADFSAEEVDSIAVKVFSAAGKQYLFTDTILDLGSMPHALNHTMDAHYQDYEFSDFYFVLEIPSRKDTIDQISYKLDQRRVTACGNCWGKESTYLEKERTGHRYELNNSTFEGTNVVLYK